MGAWYFQQESPAQSTERQVLRGMAWQCFRGLRKEYLPD